MGLSCPQMLPTGSILSYTVVPVMNGHPRDQAKVSVHCRCPLTRGTDGHVEMSRDIDIVVVHSTWPLTTGVAQGRYYSSLFVPIFVLSSSMYFELWQFSDFQQGHFLKFKMAARYHVGTGSNLY